MMAATPTILIRHPQTYLAERAYVFDVVLSGFLGLEWEARAGDGGKVELTVPAVSESARLLLVDGLFAMPQSIWLARESLPRRPLVRWALDGTPITPTLVRRELPVVYGNTLDSGSFYEETNREIRLGIDLFGSVFFQLTRYEELACEARDEHDRFPAEATLAYAENFLNRPLANEYVEVLWAALQRLWPPLRRRRRSSNEYLSHDVDWPLQPALSAPRAAKAALGDVVRRHDLGLARARRHAARHRAPTRDPYNTFDFIMALSERKGLRSAFYFQAGRTNANFDGTYSLDDPWIGELIRRIHERGHEVGLHPSYGTFRDAGAILAERDALARACERLRVEQPEWGGRQHFLRWENPTTWRGWEQAGLAYDSSLGFSHDPGFRCGVCIEYPVFDLLAREPLKLRERPLVAMEMALFGASHSSDKRGLDTLARLRARCRLVGGDFTLLWHNSRLASRRDRRLYEMALDGAL
jgi:Family of unknown function (DUF7033)